MILEIRFCLVDCCNTLFSSQIISNWRCIAFSLLLLGGLTIRARGASKNSGAQVATSPSHICPYISFPCLILRCHLIFSISSLIDDRSHVHLAYTMCHSLISLSHSRLQYVFLFLYLSILALRSFSRLSQCRVCLIYSSTLLLRRLHTMGKFPLPTPLASPHTSCQLFPPNLR